VVSLAAKSDTCAGGSQPHLTNDEADDLVMKVAAGEVDHVEDIAATLQADAAPRP
jgi:hypothetical protein